MKKKYNAPVARVYNVNTTAGMLEAISKKSTTLSGSQVGTGNPYTINAREDRGFNPTPSWNEKW